MTATGTAPRQGALGKVAFVAVLLGALVLLAYVARGDRAGEPLDPNSTQPEGAKGLVEVLGEVGADVEVVEQVPEPGTGEVALVLVDTMDDAERRALVEWVQAGGRLVIADPLSPLTPLVVGSPDPFQESIAPDTCDIGPLEGLGDLESPATFTYEVAGPDVRSCYGGEDDAYIVSFEQGDGVVTALAGGGPLTNELIDEGDNAPMAVNLLAPEPGTSVQVLDITTTADDGASGEEDTDELVGPNVRHAVLQLVVAFLFYVLWRAIRFGKPVLEPQPIQAEGSELVAAVGRLLQQNRSPQAAAERLRHDLRRTLEDRLGVPADLPAEVAVDLVVDRTGLDPRTVAAAVEPTPITDDAGLVQVVRAIDHVRAEVLHGRHP